MIELTQEQREAVGQGEPLWLTDPVSQKRYAVMSEDTYHHLLAQLDDQKDRKLQRGWQKLAGRGIALTLDES